jgi:hypothetical protein
MTIRTRISRLVHLAGLATLAASLMAAGCGKTTTYEYVDVAVTVDPSTVSKVDLATMVVTCELTVTGAEMSSALVLPCVPSQNYNLGTFEWTTTLKQGALQFTVTLFALNRVVFATGTSDPVQIVPGQKLSASVLVVGVPMTMTGTGGAGGGPGTGGAGGVSGGGGGGSGGSTGGGGIGGATATGGAGGGAAGTSGGGGRGGSGGTAGAGGGGRAGATGGGGGVGGMSGSTGAGGSSAGGDDGTAGAGGAGGA